MHREAELNQTQFVANRSSMCEESELHFNFSLLSAFVLEQY